jgi:hypothetical protein
MWEEQQCKRDAVSILTKIISSPDTHRNKAEERTMMDDGPPLILEKSLWEASGQASGKHRTPV